MRRAAYGNHALISLIANGVVLEQQTACLLKLHYEVSYLELVGRRGHWGEVCHGVYVIDPVPQSSTPVSVSGGAGREMEFV